MILNSAEVLTRKKHSQLSVQRNSRDQARTECSKKTTIKCTAQIERNCWTSAYDIQH
jgi:hypothetical protein